MVVVVVLMMTTAGGDGYYDDVTDDGCEENDVADGGIGWVRMLWSLSWWWQF